MKHFPEFLPFYVGISWGLRKTFYCKEKRKNNHYEDFQIAGEKKKSKILAGESL